MFIKLNTDEVGAVGIPSSNVSCILVEDGRTVVRLVKNVFIYNHFTCSESVEDILDQVSGVPIDNNDFVCDVLDALKRSDTVLRDLLNALPSDSPVIDKIREQLRENGLVLYKGKDYERL